MGKNFKLTKVNKAGNVRGEANTKMVPGQIKESDGKKYLITLSVKHYKRSTLQISKLNTGYFHKYSLTVALN